MDHVVDLDSAAAEITGRLSALSAPGLTPWPATWRAELAPRPHSERALVTDPDSIGVRIRGTDEWAELHLVPHRGGWTDLDALTDDAGLMKGPHINTPDEFGRLLDSAQARRRVVTAPQLVALVRDGAGFERGHLVERPEAVAA